MTDEGAFAVVAAVYDAIAERDLERLLRLCDADWRLHVDTDAIGGGDYKGHDGLRRWFDDVGSQDDFITTVTDMAWHEGRVAVLSTTSARAGDGRELSFLALSFWTVEDGRVRAIEGVTDPARVDDYLSRIPFRR